MTEEQKRWTIRLVRADGLRSHTLTAGRPGMLAGASAFLAALLMVGFVLGQVWQRRAEADRLAVLDAELQTLRRNAGDVVALGTRLEAIEDAYARLQAAVTDGAPSPGPTLTPPVEPSPRDEPTVTAPAWPLAQRGFVTRTFGSRDEGGLLGHTGVDIAVPNGSYVRAMRTGLVEEAGADDVYGLFVRIAHGDGLSSLYGHNSWLFAQPGDSVQRLQVIALSGNTGRSTAPHLHFELMRDGELLDPLAFVNQGGGDILGGVRGAGVEQR